MYYITVLFCGILFGIGLTVSSMINPNKILNFLDITGDWDPSLAFVMLGAISVTWLGFRFVLKRPSPVLSKKFFLPTKTTIDRRLIIGSAIFGMGWGMAGYCPGPAICAMGLGSMDAVYFVFGMIISMIIAPLFSKK